MKHPFDLSAQLVLEDTRTRLEPLTWDHLDHLMPISEATPTLLAYSPSPFGSPDKLKAYFEEAFAAKEKGSRYPMAIFDKQAQRYAGSTSFGAIANAHQRLEIGWTWLGKDFQRTGLNRHNKFLMLRYAFEELGFARVELKTDARNQQSRDAMLAIGATYEGHLRSHTLMPDGFRRGTVYYSILADEWPDIKRRVFHAMS